MTVQEFIEMLEKHHPGANVRFSVADDSSEDEGERWFVEDGIEDLFGDVGEITICLVGKSNLSSS